MTRRHGARPHPDGGWEVELWAPLPDEVALALLEGASERRLDPVDAGPDDAHDGWYRWHLDGVAHGQRYWIEIDGERRPDPASRWQPEGVDGPSALVDPARFTWTDDTWAGPADLRGEVIYELHVGTFTAEGTFEAAAQEVAALADLGITVVELMPIAQFPGGRNWGYDGVLPSAAQNTYGGPEGLAHFVDHAHRAGVAVILDVVYNHFGPEGNHLREFGPYFTDVYATPWGEAVNVAEAGSDHVRQYFLDSALGWIRDFHVDGFRLDAVHAIVDPTASPFLEELTTAVHDAAAPRPALVIAESSDNDPRLVRPTARGGFAMDGVWHDEVHHAIRVALTGEREGYYVDFTGAADLATALRRNLVFAGEHSPARARRHGRPSEDVESFRYVVCDQNHDQVGNRAFGERLEVLVDAERRRVAAAVVALTPFTPMLFMGEEYGETNPFPYFVSHTDPDLVEAVRRGRLHEFAAFEWNVEPPDPAAPETFASAVLDRSRRDDRLESLWRSLLAARRDNPVLHDPAADHETTLVDDAVLHHRVSADGEVVVVWNLGPRSTAVTLPDGPWNVLVSTQAMPEPEGPSISVPGWTGLLLARA